MPSDIQGHRLLTIISISIKWVGTPYNTKSIAKKHDHSPSPDILPICLTRVLVVLDMAMMAPIPTPLPTRLLHVKLYRAHNPIQLLAHPRRRQNMLLARIMRLERGGELVRVAGEPGLLGARDGRQWVRVAARLRWIRVCTLAAVGREPEETGEVAAHEGAHHCYAAAEDA